MDAAEIAARVGLVERLKRCGLPVVIVPEGQAQPRAAAITTAGGKAIAILEADQAARDHVDDAVNQVLHMGPALSAFYVEMPYGSPPDSEVR